MKNSSALKLTITALLITIGIVIPMFSPLKIVLEPASFTLASHVAIFIAIYISPGVAVAVAIGTAAGFFFGGFPIVIVFRAASHVVFALVGALIIKRLPDLMSGGLKLRGLSLGLALIHAICELAVVSIFYFSGGMSQTYYQSGFMLSVLLLVGLGTVVHSMIDFEIAFLVVKPLRSRLAAISAKV